MPEVGESVLVNYAGRLGDGREFESTWRDGGPLEVRLGSGRLLPQVEKTLCEMLPGERATLELKAADAFGCYDEDLVITVPAQKLPQAEKLPVGRFVELRTARGDMRAKVVSADDDRVVLDCNHELAGQDVVFDIELLSVVRPSAVERELHPAGCACGCDKLREQIG